ncbi:ubiquinol-cytochrome-c reductase complex assembly factor 1-like [Oppia nitens]|uniref:ubiquinol-cytochrome-c reductase complex assembly factor 1-like n=1 Tax=Oppia nitens TaxID=1686743 RepID=UPI0023DC6146|nr:ubiquinol-cytochrome-c reductase complex assembly factor 1-like [Oppia nitens]
MTDHQLSAAVASARRSLSVSAVQWSSVGNDNYSPFDTMDGLVYRLRRWFGYTTIPRYRLHPTSVYLYEACSDGIPIEKFFAELRLTDTYLSWFLVTQLHVWMCLVRCMSAGQEGRVLRNEVVARMWDDCQSRLKLLAPMTSKVRRQSMDQLLQQFQAMIVAYDEGLLTDDKTLCAALWRTLFIYESIDPKHLELMVNYIRTQLDHLHTIETEKFLLNGKFVWKPFPPLYP